MADFTYPSTDLEQGRALLRTLGSFWSIVYDGSAQVKSYLVGRALVEQQSHLSLLEAEACVGRQTVPIFHKRNWHLLRIKQSEMNAHDGALLGYGDGAIHGNQDDGYEYKYDEARKGVFSVAVPENLERAPLIMNRITDPSALLTHGVDYILRADRNAIEFVSDPFDNPLVEQGAIWEDGQITDYEAFLWIFKGEFDHNHIYDHFAHVLGMRLRSSEPSRELLNAIFDAVAGGSAVEQIMGALSAMSGIPIVREISEMVEVVTTDQNNLLVITNHHVYKFNKTATATVSVGDIVTAGQSLVNELTVHEFNRGQLSSSIGMLALPPGFLSAGFYSDLQFENTDVTLNVTEGTPPIAIAPSAVPLYLSAFSAQGFTQYIRIFGIPVLATATVEYKKLLHVANTLAQYLDSDASGVVDDRLVTDSIVQQGATLLITKNLAEAATLDSAAWVTAGYGATTFVYNDEIIPGDGADTALKAPLQMISRYGYAVAYPGVFGENKDSKVGILMDAARGDYYETIPAEYPASAWFHEYDATCDYACQVREYIYWSLSSILGVQAERQSQIRDTWELYTEAEVKATQPLAHAFFTDAQYNLPTRAPTGNYTSYTRVTFDVGGFPLDVDKFFDDLHARGIAANSTLAHLLDTRVNQVGEPMTVNLPATINPLKFLAETALRGNAFVVRLSAGAFGDGAAGLQNVQFLRKIIPPHTAMLLLIELQGLRDSVNMVGVEVLTSFNAAVPLRDVVTAPDDSNRSSIRVVSGTCQ